MRKRRIFSALLAFVLSFSMIIPVCAGSEAPDEVTQDYICTTHTFHSSATSYKYEYNASSHWIASITRVCSVCGYEEQIKKSSPGITHDFQYTDSSCNGTVQTRQKSCTVCNYSTTETIRCPKGSHTKSCNWLPI